MSDVYQETEQRLFDEPIQINEIETIIKPNVLEQFQHDIEEKGVFLLGETHGVAENAAIIYTLMKLGRFRSLALEWENDWYPVIEHFLKTGNLNTKDIFLPTDGRITVEHFSLLKRLDDEKMLDKLILCNTKNAESWNQHNRDMARVILEQRILTSPLLVVAGNLHTKTDRINLENYLDVKEPLGFYINQMIGDIPTGFINYQSGEYNNLGIKLFTEERIFDDRARFFINENNNYIFQLPKATAAHIPRKD